jgi:polyisoprenoid-binding protein YceI
MRKIFLSVASIALLSACGGETTNNVESPAILKESIIDATEKVCKKGYDVENTIIGFGGFKTTEKKEVKGVFTKFTITDTKIADTPEEVFAKAKFSIPVSTIETNDIGRNKRIKEEYFGKMESTFLIKGSVVIFNKDSNQVVVNITLNNIEKAITLNYVIAGDSIRLNGELNILDFDGSDALNSINTACEALHTGADGVSKTWADVNLYISSVLKESCE